MTLTESQLEAWGIEVGAAVEPPVFIALRGDLGAGKSVLARAIARGAGVTDIMPSPTFNMAFRYRGHAEIEVVHMDLYRLDRAADVWALGWSELGGPAEITLVEWPERAEALLPLDRWDISLAVAGPDLRNVRATPIGRVPALPALAA